MIKNNLSTSPWNPQLNGEPSINPIAIGDSRNKSKLKHLLYNKHSVEFFERFKWNNLPKDIPQDLIERIMYYRFKGMFFKYSDQFFFLPFALKGTIDPYGRYEKIVPTLFTGKWDEASKKFDDELFLPSSVSDGFFYAKYSLEGEKNDKNAVILTDQTLHISQDLTPPAYTIDPLIDQLVDVLVLVNIDLMSSAKVYTIIAPDEASKASIESEFQELDNNIRNGNRYVVVTGNGLPVQELSGSNTKDSARYFQTFQSIDNLRKSILGIDTGSTFQKMEHMTMDESEANSSGDSVLKNALRQREEFCKLINYYFDLNVSVEINIDESQEIIGDESSQTEQLRGDDE